MSDTDRDHKEDMEAFLCGLGAKEVIWPGEAPRERPDSIIPSVDKDGVALGLRDYVKCHPAFRELQAQLSEAEAEVERLESVLESVLGMINDYAARKVIEEALGIARD